MLRRVLVVITTKYMPWDGLTTVAMNYYRAMDKSGMQMDFVSDNETEPVLKEELLQNGSTYIKLPDRKKYTVRYMVALYRKLKEGKYDVIHIHGNSATMIFDLFPAWMLKVKKRIVHVHNVRNSHAFIHNTMKPVLNCLLTDRVAVSEEAGHYLYGGRKFCILNNAIDVDRYRFEQQSRLACRKEWGIPEPAFVVGTVGRMNVQKNQKFLVEIFSNILHIVPDAKLLIVGDGELRGELEDQVKRLGIEGSCILTGMQADIAYFLAAMDIFVFPSLYEGFGLALLEAQANGLCCIASTGVPDVTNATNMVFYIDLQRPEKWIEQIRMLKAKLDKNRIRRSERNILEIRKNGLDIIYQAGALKELYK